MPLRAHDDPIEHDGCDSAHDEEGGQIHWTALDPQAFPGQRSIARLEGISACAGYADETLAIA